MMSVPAFAEATPERLARMARTAADLHVLLTGVSLSVLGQRPAVSAWSATEILCHLRDVEEAYLDRMRLILLNAQPVLVQFDPVRWNGERQYQRQDAGEALAAFAARRAETLAFTGGLTIEEWERSGRHPSRGALSVRKIVHSIAKHDTEHVDQVKRALAGLP
jgi:uncharacterized damage-inducible protein DinB